MSQNTTNMASASSSASTVRRRSSGDKNTSVAVEACLGGVASAAACVVSNPIDIIRTKMQLGQTSFRFGPYLTAGLGPAMAYNVVLNATRFSLFRAVEADDRVGPLTNGLFAGGVAGLIASPFARWRTILQAGDGTTRSSMSELMARPFAGAPAWALRNAGHTAFIFHLYTEASIYLEYLCSSRMNCHMPPTLLHLASSLFAASVSCVLMNPLDVYCTRVFHSSQPVLLGASGGSMSVGSVGAPSSPPVTFAASSSAITGGATTSFRAAITAGYAGLTANLLRTVPHTVLTFTIVEWLRRPLAASLADRSRSSRSSSSSSSSKDLLDGLTAPIHTSPQLGRARELAHSVSGRGERQRVTP